MPNLEENEITKDVRYMSLFNIAAVVQWQHFFVDLQFPIISKDFWEHLKPQSHYRDNQSPTSDNHLFWGGCQRSATGCRYSVTVA